MGKIEDSFWKSYLFGTSEEMKNYQEKQKGKSRIREESLETLLGVETLGLVAVGSFVSQVLAAPLIVDTGIRLAYDFYAWIKYKDRSMIKPGLVGTVRELYQKYKK